MIMKLSETSTPGNGLVVPVTCPEELIVFHANDPPVPVPEIAKSNPVRPVACAYDEPMSVGNGSPDGATVGLLVLYGSTPSHCPTGPSCECTHRYADTVPDKYGDVGGVD